MQFYEEHEFFFFSLVFASVLRIQKLRGQTHWRKVQGTIYNVREKKIVDIKTNFKRLKIEIDVQNNFLECVTEWVYRRGVHVCSMNCNFHGLKLKLDTGWGEHKIIHRVVVGSGLTVSMSYNPSFGFFHKLHLLWFDNEIRGLRE